MSWIYDATENTIIKSLLEEKSRKDCGNKHLTVYLVIVDKTWQCVLLMLTSFKSSYIDI